MIMVKKIYKQFKEILLFIRVLSRISKKKENKPIAFIFRVSPWKRPYMVDFIPEYELIYVPKAIRIHTWYKLIASKGKGSHVFIIWGYEDREDRGIEGIAEKNGVPVHRVEDGFVRSVGLGSKLTAPYSICLDKKGMYFDSTRESDLENLLNQYNFAADLLLMDRAALSMELMLSKEISKYNHLSEKETVDLYGSNKGKRILVIGQVEDDASIRKGSRIAYTNNDLVRIARNENPEAEIFYKPHPDVLEGTRPMQSNPDDVAEICNVMREPVSLTHSLKGIDHVYTITSLSGFEALLRGIKVTTLGAPFYSGWGLTDDRQKTGRRNRNLTIEELFAGAYILYPRYRDPIRKLELTLEETIELIDSQRS
jgi:capsular polysaccharide export protein